MKAFKKLTKLKLSSKAVRLIQIASVLTGIFLIVLSAPYIKKLSSTNAYLPQSTQTSNDAIIESTYQSHVNRVSGAYHEEKSSGSVNETTVNAPGASSSSANSNAATASIPSSVETATVSARATDDDNEQTNEIALTSHNSSDITDDNTTDASHHNPSAYESSSSTRESAVITTSSQLNLVNPSPTTSQINHVTTTTARPTTVRPTYASPKTTVAVTTMPTTTTSRATTTAPRTTTTTHRVTTTTYRATTTTSRPPTTAPTTSPPTTKPAETGKFTFTVYGYGHGVGMSQYGANIFAKQGWGYQKLLKYYYPGVSIAKEDATNKVISMKNEITGKTVQGTVLEVISQAIEAEMGSSFNIEALKAQAVAAYGFYKTGGRTLPMKPANSRAIEATKAVLGEYCTYNGQPAKTLFFAMAAGKTTSSGSVWGGSTLPYLKGGVAPPSGEKNLNKYKTTVTYSSEELKRLVKSGLGIELTGNPKNWIKIISHDSSIDSKTGYVSKLQVGSSTVSGQSFRASVTSYKIRSHCFTISYESD